uniref:hypothetical protein n=1 Tax=Alloprevotella sp. TaxID=1872471 RepID=UPI0040271D47
MRIKTFALAFPLFFTSLCAVGQEVTDVKSQINQIKKNTSDYIYAEITATTEPDAKMLAEDLLYEEINKWAATQQNLQASQKFLVNNKTSCITTLSTTRGNMFRCFMYIRKSDIQNANNADLVENTSLKSDRDVQTSTTAQSDSTSQTSVAAQADSTSQTTTTSVPIQSEAAAQPVSTSQPVTAAQPVVEEPSIKEEKVVTQSRTQDVTETGSRSLYPQVVKTLATLRTYSDMIAKAQAYKTLGEIVELVTNKFPESIEQYYLVIYDQQGRVQALLTPGMQRVNVCTGNDDSEKNYHGCKAFAFKVK